MFVEKLADFAFNRKLSYKLLASDIQASRKCGPLVVLSITVRISRLGYHGRGFDIGLLQYMVRVVHHFPCNYFCASSGFLSANL